MKILTLNFRINSVEYEIFEIEKINRERELCRGSIERIGSENPKLVHKSSEKKVLEESVSVIDHHSALDVILKHLSKKECSILRSPEEIDAVGHRVVHGGQKFVHSVIIDEEVKKEIYRNFELAPLHNPYNLKGIESVEKLLPGKVQVAVFDTSFHTTLPEVASLYPLPVDTLRKLRIKKYGFHGISHRYVMERTSYLLKKSPEKLKLISIHLGQGASLCAIKNGISIDTSMGFTPLEGLMMTTRSGDIDPGVIIFLQKSGWSLDRVDTLLNKESGILGVSGISSDMKEVVEEMKKGNASAKLAVELFVYRIRKYIGAYNLILGGATSISFTGGIGENSDIIREMICSGLEFMGILFDSRKNKSAVEGREMLINKASSKIKIAVIPRNEKLIIARDVFKVVSGK